MNIPWLWFAIGGILVIGAVSLPHRSDGGDPGITLTCEVLVLLALASSVT